MKKLIVLGALAIFNTAMGQDLTPVFEDTVFEGRLLKLSSQNYYTSNRFNNALMDKFVVGGTITNEIKDRARDKMRGINAIGAEANQELTFYNSYIHPFRSSRFGMSFSVSDHHFASGNIAPDLYEAAFYGNAAHVNDTMNFSYSHFQYQHFQKIGIGIFEKKSMSGVRVSYVAGSKEMQGRLNNAWMYSRTDSVFLMLQGSGYRSEKFYPYWGFNGSGFSVDANYNFSFKSKKGKLQAISVRVNNLGVIFWKPSTINYAVDSMSVYSGFDVNELINQPDDSNPTYNFGDTLGIVEERGARARMLPVVFSLEKIPVRNNGEKMQFIAGFKTILVPDYFPYLYGGVYYQPSQNFSASTRLSYGGFGGLQWGFDVNYWAAQDKVILRLGSSNILGAVSSNLGAGRSVNISAGFKF